MTGAFRAEQTTFAHGRQLHPQVGWLPEKEGHAAAHDTTDVAVASAKQRHVIVMTTGQEPPADEEQEARLVDSVLQGQKMFDRLSSHARHVKCPMFFP